MARILPFSFSLFPFLLFLCLSVLVLFLSFSAFPLGVLPIVLCVCFPETVGQVAESLYIAGYLSYPRTESSAYPKSFDLRSVQRACCCCWNTATAQLVSVQSSSEH